jgi:DNA-binding NarL/FixJ family response regulator
MKAPSADKIELFLICKRTVYFRAVESLLLENGITIKASYEDPELALQALPGYIKRTPLIVLDANWRNQLTSEGILIKRLRAIVPAVKIILVTTFYENRLSQQLEAMGADGYIHRNVNNFNLILNCIKNVRDGHKCIVPGE